MKILMGRITSLEATLKRQGEMIQQLKPGHVASASATMGSWHNSVQPPKLSASIETRISFLERVEDEHSCLLIAQAKADAEMHSDIDAMKSNFAVLDGKVTYCMDMIDETFTESDGKEEEEEEEETPVVDDDEADDASE